MYKIIKKDNTFTMLHI